MIKKIKRAGKIFFPALLVFYYAFGLSPEFAFATDVPDRIKFEIPKSDPVIVRQKIENNPLPLISLVAVGDLMMGSWVIDIVNREGYDFPFDSTRTIIKSADVAVANLEAPFSLTGTSFEKKYTFKVPPVLAQGIKNAGFDVLTLANNHMVDFGCEGVMNTRAALDSFGLFYCGAGANREQACSPVYVDCMGVKVAFIAFSLTFPKEFWADDTSCGTCFASERSLKRALAESEKNADVTIVSFHWGAEKMTVPKDYQIHLAHSSIDAGADLVLGHHPHVLQGIEIYKNKLIAYSLGNYVFGSFSRNSKDSIVLQTLISPQGLINAHVYPINVYNHEVGFQPRLVKGKERSRIIENLNGLSRDLNFGKNLIDQKGFIFP